MKISIKNLTKSFNNKVVLDNISIELEEFHSLAIIGPSGGGKSTLLRILAGIERPDSGEIYINNKRLDFEEKKIREYRKSIGVVFQAYNLFPHLTSLENIVIPLEKIHKVKVEEATKIAEELLERFKLSEHRDKRPSKLSGGQQQRVALARALAIKSEFLLLDEPTSALDPELTSEVLAMILELEKSNKDLILVTHEMGFARQACDKLIFISGGKIKEMGDSSKVFSAPKTKELQNFLDKILEWK
ncbi:amino acid ABC transporter ATP-binding protein [Clostridium algidicarnis]|uniref:amino acid ABC transporter ATP-binding protein n=1 Tax=Clostridium algidicarnis TaxID=37659 RepID=UPI0016257A04|nr:amino acid ABC transporter ATP-binding protein [Clostridium algidicarnis]MBB6696546.1 amino acid ABC transporter ATP-binding protein [Clostridium algidicarnis]